MIKISQNEEALKYIKRAFLLIWTLFGYPSNEQGLWMTKNKIEELMAKLHYADLSKWMKN